MGLDMYAHRRRYVKQWDHHAPEERYEVTVRKGGKLVEDINPALISHVEEEVMYWRKANHIHGWFVNNVQNGVDNCAIYYVSTNKLKALLDACERVIENSELVKGKVHTGIVYDKDNPDGVAQWAPGWVIDDCTVAKEELPVYKGSFFGTYQYDEYYLQDVVDTHNWLTKMLQEPPKGWSYDIFYSSSW